MNDFNSVLKMQNVQLSTRTGDFGRTEKSRVGDGQAVSKYHWGQGLRLVRQKTLSLDAEMLDELSMLIVEARRKLNRDNDENSDEILSARVLDFPGSV